MSALNGVTAKARKDIQKEYRMRRQIERENDRRVANLAHAFITHLVYGSLETVCLDIGDMPCEDSEALLYLIKQVQEFDYTGEMRPSAAEQLAAENDPEIQAINRKAEKGARRAMRKKL